MKFNTLQIATQNNMQVNGLGNHFESLKSDIIVSLTKSEVGIEGWKRATHQQYQKTLQHRQKKWIQKKSAVAL